MYCMYVYICTVCIVTALEVSRKIQVYPRSKVNYLISFLTLLRSTYLVIKAHVTTTFTFIISQLLLLLLSSDRFTVGSVLGTD
jgi:hypothetical protein